MHAKKFAPKNGPTASSAPIDHEAPTASASTVEVPKATKAVNKKRKQGDATFKSGTEGEATGGASLASLMNNFKKAAR